MVRWTPVLFGAVVILAAVVVGGPASALMCVGDPIPGGSWSQNFGVGTYYGDAPGITEIDFYMTIGAFELYAPPVSYGAFGGWGPDPAGEPYSSTEDWTWDDGDGLTAYAMGSSLGDEEYLEFCLNFAGELVSPIESSDPVEFVYVAFTGTGEEGDEKEAVSQVLASFPYEWDEYTGNWRFFGQKISHTVPLSGGPGGPAVPEPTSCALLALALGSVGAVLRRRRKV